MLVLLFAVCCLRTIQMQKISKKKIKPQIVLLYAISPLNETVTFTHDYMHAFRLTRNARFIYREKKNGFFFLRMAKQQKKNCMYAYRVHSNVYSNAKCINV